jgi:hypothetical protein
VRHFPRSTSGPLGHHRKGISMGLIKGSGQTASETRKGTLHGSQSRRRMAKWGGQLQRRGQKPEGPKGPARASNQGR